MTLPTMSTLMILSRGTILPYDIRRASESIAAAQVAVSPVCSLWQQEMDVMVAQD